jgi:hypothetical protein
MTQLEERTESVLATQRAGPAAEIRSGAWPRLIGLWDADLVQPLGVFLLSRLLFVLLTYFGVVLFRSVLHGPHPSFAHDLLRAWNQWDANWYADIARRGYDWTKPVGTGPAAFFPLFPLLIRAGVIVTHRSYETVALLISNTAFVGALIYLWKLSRWELNAAVAGRAILYIAVFPTALFFFAGYSESLFLLLTVGCFYHLRRRDWLAAGLLGGLASATRVTGVLLVLPFAYEYLRDANFSLRRAFRLDVLGLILVPAGLLAFMLYLSRTLGDPMAFDRYQAAWQKITTPFLWSGFLESLRQIVLVQPSASFYEAHNVINVVLGGLFLGWSVMAARRLPLGYGLYLLGFWVTTLSTPAMAGGYPVPLISLSRYVLSLFPVFMYAGILGRSRSFHDACLVLSVGMLSLLTVQFINGGWVI